MSDLGDALAMGTDENMEQMYRAIEAENRFRTSYGLQLLSANDSMDNLSYNFAGLGEIYEQSMMTMAGAAEIPATKLFGRSPQGMNATGESDLRNYYEMISGLQERMLRPALEKLLPVMAASCLGYAPEGMQIVFEPVKTMSATEQVALAKAHTELVIAAAEKGIITREEAREEMAAWRGRTEVWGKIQ